jgi:hypothetical protein
VLQVVNINRINILFIPLIICMAIPLTWSNKRFSLVRWILIAFLLAEFVFFFHDLNGTQYRLWAGDAFSEGLLPAIESARQTPNVPICVTNTVNMPYIDVLFVEHTPPNEFLYSVKYIDPSDPFRVVRSFGRYTFSLEECARTPNTVYILLNDKESPPNNGIQFQVEHFTHFAVYKPQ